MAGRSGIQEHAVRVARFRSAFIARYDEDEWRQDAACRDLASEVFFPAGPAGGLPGATALARAICASCPVEVSASSSRWRPISGTASGVGVTRTKGDSCAASGGPRRSWSTQATISGSSRGQLTVVTGTARRRCLLGFADPFGVLPALGGAVRDRVVGATNGLFAHGPYPLEDTLTHPGDPGLFGPESMTWRLVGDTAVFVGGIRALIIQAAHPEVVAGVAEHPVSGGSPWPLEPNCGLRHGHIVRLDGRGRAHGRDRPPSSSQRLRGLSKRGAAYDAADPGLAAWVHNSLTDSFLTAYRTYGARRSSTEEADRFVAEQTRVGVLLGADPLPAAAAALSEWISDHPALATSPGQVEAIQFSFTGLRCR